MQRQIATIPRSFQEFGRWQREGDAGIHWLGALPDTIAGLCARWRLRINGDTWHGDNGVAVPVRRDGAQLVLKVNWPDHALEEQVQALRFWDGRSTVQLVESDTACGALLLERLDHLRSLDVLPLEQAIPTIGTLLRRLAIPVPRDYPYRTTTEVAADLHDALAHRWKATGRPFAARVLDTAVGLAAELSTSAPCVMVDGDLKYEHVLRGSREPWLVIDPLVLVGDIEYQCGQLLWTRCDEMIDEARLRWCLDALVDAAQLDPARAHAWAFLRAVDYWVWGPAAGFMEDPVRCQRIVEALL